MVSGQGTRLGRGVFNIGASVGSMLAPPLVAWAILSYNWQSAFLITGGLGLVWVTLWLLLYNSPERHPALSDTERKYIATGQEEHLRGDAARPSVSKVLRQRNFWESPCRASSRILPGARSRSGCRCT